MAPLSAHPQISDTRELTFAALRKAYESGRVPADVLREVMERVATCRRGVWITVLNEGQIQSQLGALEAVRKAGKSLPLYGVPFAVKDNIDVAGIPTTAACAAFAYTPAVSATCVRKLCEAGAIVVGKTNLDQFATGLVGTRSPYGACENAFDPAYISGGSSSGSAVSVAAGLVSFSLGTDTAGSGRVPAAFNNIVGLKPSRGLISTAGVVPACRSIDCVSIFALSAEDAEMVMGVAGGLDEADPLTRVAPPRMPSPPGGAGGGPGGPFRVGIPDKLEFFGNRDAEKLFGKVCDRIRATGAVMTTIDFAPFRGAGDLLYNGPWVAERLVAAGRLLKEKPEVLRHEIRTILTGALKYTAGDAFEAQYRLAALRKKADEQLARVHVLLAPTAPTIYRIAEVEADPLVLNRNLGTYTTFVNLLDMCGIAVPAGFLSNGLPWGVTVLGKAFEESMAISLGSRIHQAVQAEVSA